MLQEACSKLSPGATPRAVEWLYSAAKACASRRCFLEALLAYDAVTAYIGEGTSSLWSVLLYCSVEAEDFRRCPQLYLCLQRQGVPSGHDFVNMVRYYVHNRDPSGLRGFKLASAVQLDELIESRSLAVCAAAGARECAEALVCDGDALGEVAYNTLLKCYMTAGQLDQCLDLWGEMERSGSRPSAATYGILLDACVRMKDVERATMVFNVALESGVLVTADLYTTFIKGLVKAGELLHAWEIVRKMRETSVLAPELSTCSALLKAHADLGD
eukprot:6486264-Amphidinium_carterae.1